MLSFRPRCAHLCVGLMCGACLAFGSGLQLGLMPVTVVLDFERAEHAVPLTTVSNELQKLLSGAHLQVDVRLRNELTPNPQFGEVLVFRMRGACSATPALPVGALSDERGALAMTYTTDGQILPFGEVECDRVRQSLTRLWSRETEDQHMHEFGVALARVMAHEIYHMLGQSAVHTKSGVTKESLSAHDLTRPVLDLPDAARRALTTKSAAGMF